MLHKQCPQCENKLSLREKICPQCGQRVRYGYTLKKFMERGRFRLAFLSIILILVVGLGWFLRADTGSRWPLFLVFFIVAPLVPWILKLAYKHADPPQEDKNNNDK